MCTAEIMVTPTTIQIVFVWIERQTDPYVLAVEKATGKTVWKVPGLGAASWSTPALLPVNMDKHLVLSGSGLLAGYDPKDGKRLWSFDGLSGNTIPTPQPCGDGQFLLGATLARGEEGAGKAAASNGIIRITKNEVSNFQVDFKWQCKRATSSFGSPIIHDGLAYFVNGAGVLFCVDAESGEEVYSERIGDSIWATPLAIGNRIYFAGKSGSTTVVEAGRQFRVLAQNRLWDSEGEATDSSKNAKQQSGDLRPAASEQKQRVQYAIATVPGRLLIRSGDAIHCISER